MALPLFCPFCGQSVEPLGHSIGRCVGCSEEIYANSRPTGGVLLIRDDHVLLVRRGAEPEVGRWDIPGGFLDEGESPEDGTCREMRERTLALLDGFSEQDLDTVSANAPEGWEETFGTYRHCLQYVADHWYMHRGQLADARRAAGLQRMWV